MPVFLLVTALVTLTFAVPARDGIRDRFLRGLVMFGSAVAFSTELLSVFHLLGQAPLIAFWTAVIGVALLPILKRGPRFVCPRLRADPIAIISAIGITAILALTAVTAAFSPPNSSDAMAYHMPRVVYWAQQFSVKFFPTPYFNQIMLQPMAEYLILHTWVLSGGDHFANFVQWLALFGSIVAVSAIARLFGATVRGQAIAALFCATLPAGILASSGAKNDYFLALWLAATVYFALRFRDTDSIADALFLGAALGLALLTKATGYLFAPWFLAAIFLARQRKFRRRLLVPALIAAAIALALNTPQYVRNYELSGSIMGFDSAHGDGFFRWRNETLGWRETLSNVLRNVSDQLGVRSTEWNQGVYNAVARIHARLGIELNDPSTTWRWSTFTAPINANHEVNAPNRWHLAILFVMAGVLAWRALRGRDHERALYAAALPVAFLAFCAYLKWQPFLARMFLPLFVLGAPLASIIAEAGEGKRRVLSLIIPTAACLLLLDNARRPVLENWVRPLKGPRSVLRVPRDVQYFSDLASLVDQNTYTKAATILASSKCRNIGIDISNLAIEYPIQALLLETHPRTRFTHTGVHNASSQYASADEPEPCAVVCLDCAGDAARLDLYRDFRSRAEPGKFVVFVGK